LQDILKNVIQQDKGKNMDIFHQNVQDLMLLNAVKSQINEKLLV
jgi:hypothetical protein